MKKLFILLFICSFSAIHSNAQNTSSTFSTTQCEAYLWFGTTYTNSGTYNHTYINSSGGVHTETLLLTIVYGSTNTSHVTACNVYTWDNGITYTVSGIYSYTYLNQYGCQSTSYLNLNLNNGVHLSPKAFLYGAYDITTGLMKDSLRAAVALGNPNGPIPVPYLIPPHIPTSPTHFMPSNGAFMNQSVLSISGPNAIVDWVLIELRDQINNNLILARKHALIQRDGDVVETDGISALFFAFICPGHYFVSIKHRNHLGVMTATPIALSSVTQVINFATDPVWVKAGVSNPPRKQVQNVFTLIAGDAMGNRNVKYNGPNNDKEYVFYAVLGSVPPGYPYPPSNNTTYGYRNEDINLDGKVRFVNEDNDKTFMLNMILEMAPNNSPNDQLTQHTPN
jgi:hypothetical protein